MQGIHLIAIALCIAISISTTTSTADTRVTSIALGQVPNSVYFGDEVKVSGQLIAAYTKEGIVNALNSR